MKYSLARSLLYLTLVLALACTGTAAYGADAASFNPVSVQTSARSAGVPVGMVVAWPAAVNPQDAPSWLECNGQPTNGYPELAAVVGANVPDLRGKFLRGLGGSSAALGITQGDAIRNITGSSGNLGTWPGYGSGSGALSQADSGSYPSKDGGGNPLVKLSFDASKSVPTANENRPVNMAVRYLIRARP